MTIIYIYGHTAQGKTTLAHKFKGYIISTDKCYNYMHLLEQTENSIHYASIIKHNQNKTDFYTVHKISSEDIKTVIIEGSTLASEKEREFIRNIFQPTKEIFIHLKHNEHEKRHQKKHGKPPEPNYKKWYKSIYNKPEGEITITTDEEISNIIS